MADRLKTFTEEEKRLAEKNHDLVYQFLRAHSYSMEDYYNIVVFGYLKGIQKYCRYVGNNTGKNLDGICWNCMRSEMKSHFKMETAKKRQPTEIIMTKVSSAEDEVIALEILKSVMENLTIRQQNIITLKLLGYSNTEICLMMEMSKSSYYRELENIISSQYLWVVQMNWKIYRHPVMLVINSNRISDQKTLNKK